MVNAGMTRAQIKAALALRDLTFADIDRLYELPLNTCRYAAAGRRLPKGETAIAETLGVSVWHAFPDRWRTDGTRIDRRLNLEVTPEQERSDSQKVRHTLTAGKAA